VCFALQQPGQSQGDHAVAGMDADLLIGPVIHGLPAHEVRILHGAEGGLHLILTAISQNNLLGGPLVVVSEQNPSSQGGRREPLQSVCIGVIVELELSSPPLDFYPQDLLDVLARGEILGMSLETL